MSNHALDTGPAPLSWLDWLAFALVLMLIYSGERDMTFDRNKAMTRATFAHDQCLACFDEIFDRFPNAVMHAVRNDGPLASDSVVPEMSPGEWEVLRKLAQLGWAHYGMHMLTKPLA